MKPARARLKSLAFVSLALASLALPPQASARTVFLHLLHPKDKNVGMMSDVDTFAQQGYITEEERKKSLEAGQGLITSLSGLIEEGAADGMRFGDRPASKLLSELDSIDIMFDLIPKLPGFSVLGAKATEISSTQYHNVPSRRLITWPVWPAKLVPIESALVKEMSRGLVQAGILAHEAFSILGVPDQDYGASTELVLRTLVTGKTLTFKTVAEWQPQSGQLSPLKLASGGISIVGGAGNDLAFAFKLLFRALGHQLQASRLAAIEAPALKDKARELQTKFTSMPAATQASLVQALDELIVEETLSRSAPGSNRSVIEVVRHSSLQRFGVRLTDLPALEQALKNDPAALDPLVLKVADSVLTAIAAGAGTPGENSR